MTYGHTDPYYKPSRIIRGADDLDEYVVKLIIRLHDADPALTARDISDELMEHDIPVLPDVVSTVLAKVVNG
ncbi:hypothetical protein [Micromonospora sp. I033]